MEDLTSAVKSWNDLTKEVAKLNSDLEFMKSLFTHWGAVKADDACFALNYEHGFIGYEEHKKEYERLLEIIGAEK